MVIFVNNYVFGILVKIKNKCQKCCFLDGNAFIYFSHHDTIVQNAIRVRMYPRLGQRCVHLYSLLSPNKTVILEPAGHIDQSL